MPRFSLLEHTAAPDDPAGRHYDLLLEDGESCRTWRLSAIPIAGGEPVAATPIAPHRLAWLDHIDGPVSGNRGHAACVDAGMFTWLTGEEAQAAAVCVRLGGARLDGELAIDGDTARLRR